MANVFRRTIPKTPKPIESTAGEQRRLANERWRAQYAAERAQASEIAAKRWLALYQLRRRLTGPADSEQIAALETEMDSQQDGFGMTDPGWLECFAEVGSCK